MDEYKSREEEAFALWCAEAQDFGLIEGWVYEPPSWLLTPKVTIMYPKQLKTKVKLVERTLHQPHVYTCDFKMKLTALGLIAFADIFPKTYLGKEFSEMFGVHNAIVIDIKGGFALHGGARSFSINRKLMWHKHQIEVEEVVHWKPQHDRKGVPKKKPGKCFFMDTFCPKPLRLLKNLKPSAMGLACPTVMEFLEKHTTNEWDGVDPF